MIAVFAFVAALFHIAAYRSASAIIVAPMQYSQMLWAVIYGAIFFNETPDFGTAIGATVIIASGLYVVMREETVSRNRPVLRSQTRYLIGTIPRIGSLLRFRRR